jgi:hypothetical protein
MKRRAKHTASFTSRPAKKYAFRTLIPPRSTVRVKDVPRSPWRKEIGKLFRIGYYSKMDGLDCIWLVDAKGEYCQTLDHDFLDRFFDIVAISNERSLYGRSRSALKRMNN